MTLQVLIAEDDRDLQRLYQKILEYGGHKSIVAGHGNAVVPALQEHNPDVVILDMMMPGIKGTQLLQQADQWRKAKKPEMYLIVLSGDPRIEEYPEIRLADKVLQKPLGMGELLEIMRTFAAAEELRRKSDRVVKTQSEASTESPTNTPAAPAPSPAPEHETAPSLAEEPGISAAAEQASEAPAAPSSLPPTETPATASADSTTPHSLSGSQRVLEGSEGSMRPTPPPVAIKDSPSSGISTR